MVTSHQGRKSSNDLPDCYLLRQWLNAFDIVAAEDIAHIPEHRFIVIILCVCYVDEFHDELHIEYLWVIHHH